VIGRALCAVSAGALAAWAAWLTPAGGWADVAVISGASLVAGVGLALGGAAMHSVVPRLVTREEMAAAMTLNTIPVSVARVVGPALGALVLAAWGAVEALTVAALGHLVFALTVALLRIPAGPRLPRSPENGVRVAWRHVRSDRPLFLLLLAVTFLGFGSEPTLTLAPSYAEVLGGGTVLVGVLNAGFGAGAAVGLLVSIRLERRTTQARLTAFGILLMAASAVACALVPWWWAATAALALAGVGFTVAMASVSTLIQLRVPDELRGRVMALWMVGFVGARPLTSSFVGLVSDVAGARTGFAATAAVLLAAAALCRPSRIA
jgi:predicted MFS family arabinose efflux permease